MPENEEICDLVPRVRQLFEFVSNSCNKEWKGYFGEILSEIEEGKVQKIELRDSLFFNLLSICTKNRKMRVGLENIRTKRGSLWCKPNKWP